MMGEEMLELVNFAVLENLVHPENLAFQVYLESEDQGIDDRSIDHNLYKENILNHYTFKNHLFLFKTL
jgi:hypothetical protein